MIRFRSSWRWFGATLALMVLVGCEDDATPTSPAHELSPTTVTAKALAAGTTVITPADVSPIDGAWHPANERSGGTSLISTAQPDQDGGAGSLDQSLPAPTSPSPKTDFQILTEGAGGFGLLSDLDQLRFDWYRASTSTAPAHLTPAFRLYVFDPDHGSQGASYLLVWEGIYNGYPAASGPVPTDAWVREDILAGNFWRIPQFIDGVWTGFGGCDQTGSVTDPTDPSACLVFNRGLGDWALGENTVVIGVNVGLGSGWNGTYQSYADLITIGFDGASTTWDFEPGDEQPPVVLNVAVEPVAIGATGTVTATVDDTGTGNSTIVSAELTFDGGSAIAMTADDGSFNNPVEDVTGAFTAPGEPGLYEACVTGTDAGGNTSTVECTTVAVYDPSGGFVTGGGWINSPEGAMRFSTTPWMQDFSVDDEGWLDVDDAWYGGISVAGGVATFTGDDDSAPFSRFDGYRDTWPGTWIAEIDVYLDPSWPAVQGFDYSVAATGADGAHQRDFIFHVGTVENYGPIVGKALLVNGSNNADFTTNPFKLVNDNEGNYYEVTSAGWYTLQHVFRDEGGHLAVDLNLLDAGGTILWTATRENVVDAIPSEVGGNRYAWFTHIDVDGGIQVDNHELHMDGPSPEGKATFGFIAKYKKGASAPDGNTQFTFKTGDLDFHSTSYDWLVVNQNDSNAQFKGEGTVNGEPGYSFMLWAGDHDDGDTFRIQITGPGGLVYDNGSDQVIGGGSIIVHSGKGKK